MLQNIFNTYLDHVDFNCREKKTWLTNGLDILVQSFRGRNGRLSM